MTESIPATTTSTSTAAATDLHSIRADGNIDGYPECDSLPPRRRSICRGEVFGIGKTNAYRTQWGLSEHQRQTVQDGSPERQWNPSQPSRGLGDTVAKFTHAIGLDVAAESIARAVTGKPCGCKQRQAALNSAVPYRSVGENRPS